MTMDKAFWLAVREALLKLVDAIERALEMAPTTSDIRRAHKRSR